MRGKGNGEMLVKKYKLPVRRQVKPENERHSLVIIDNNTTYLKFAKRVELKCFCQKKRNGN